MNLHDRTSTRPPDPVFTAQRASPCPVCKNDQTRTIHFAAYPEPFEKCPPWEAHDKYYCPACEYLWSDRFARLDLAAYGREYVKSNRNAQRVPNERMSASLRLLELLFARTSGRRFLEYGIGYNTPYIEEVRALGFDLWACDINPTVPFEEHVVQLPDGLEKLGEDPFDGIFSEDVVEHFNDPIEDYRRLRSLLRPGGLLLSSTPILDKIWDGTEPVSNHTWLWTPWHCSVCSSRSMAILASHVELEYLGVVPVPTDINWAFLLRRPQEREPSETKRQESADTRRLRDALRKYMEEMSQS